MSDHEPPLLDFTAETADGPRIVSPDDALALVSAAAAARASVVALSAAHLDPRFFDLANGFAGEFLQKLVNYRLRLVIVGDISRHLEQSKALRDFVRESNRARQIRFVNDLAEVRRDP